ncbi:DnaJ-domain-containing protein [Trichodelitschia bisporula]|uniref:DnaJ-domain-containing protein n=1 Tax=Trichodelitschia bisporula TaxID=703511 RepID=A0A6G1HPF7_9PEZI|nr:DnaJ-domain-containing protein [Trichodelitschia bisporula]
MNVEIETEDFYEILGVERDASKIDIKKAYHKAALSSHPDKVPHHERDTAEVRFKAVSRAYEILSDDQNRHLYDAHGPGAFTPGGGPPPGFGGETNLEDILEQMFGMGGMGGMPGGRSAPQAPRKGPPEEQEYEVTLENLYTGKTTKFQATKKVICTGCKGSGGKERAKAHECSTCAGKGEVLAIRYTPMGAMQTRIECSICNGKGKMFKEKDRCKRCRGAGVTDARKVLELYIPRGSRSGDKIVLKGEADQTPGREPGDIIFELVEAAHPLFKRQGADLAAPINISLVEALGGFKRVVLLHLDGRGIELNVPRGTVIRPGQVLKVTGEGMPVKKSDARGDLYLLIKVEFPEDGWVATDELVAGLAKSVPNTTKKLEADDVEEVDFEEGDLDEFGEGGGEGGRHAHDSDDEDDDDGVPQCAQQ